MDTDPTTEDLIQMSLAAVKDPQVGTLHRLYVQALGMNPGEQRRVAVEQTKAAWQKALREFCAEYREQ